MGRPKKIVKKIKAKKAEIKKEIPKPQAAIDESNLIMTKDLDKFSRLLLRYKLKETKVDANNVKTFVFYKN